MALRRMATTAADAVTTLTPPPAAGFPGHARPMGLEEGGSLPSRASKVPRTREPRKGEVTEVGSAMGERTGETIMRAEIAESVSVTARLVADRRRFEAIGEALAARRPAVLVVAGRGTSDHAAIYARYPLSTPSASPSPSRRPASSRSTGLRAPHRRVRCSHSVSLAPAPT